MKDITALPVASLLSCSCLVLGLASCGGAGGGVVRPNDFTAKDALGTAVQCSTEPKYAKPLIVDIDADARVDLEAAMNKGVVVVSYDCKTLRVLSNCSVADAAYDYEGVGRKESVVQIKGADDLMVNLPLSAGKLSGEVQAGRSIDLGLVYVGRRTTIVSKVRREELQGSCEGATHHIVNATIGAFAMSTGSVGRAAVVADLFKVGASGKSESEKNASSRDGSLEACRTSDPSASSPPQECGSALRVELIPIVGKAVAADAAPKEQTKPAPRQDDVKAAAAEATHELDALVQDNPCPTGYVASDGICTRAEKAAAFLCDPKDTDVCKEQCDKGNAGSCFNYGTFLGRTKGGPEALPFYQKACEGDVADGCAKLAMRLKFVSKNDPDAFNKGFASAKKGCDLGSGSSCLWAGLYAGSPDNPDGADSEAGFHLNERACGFGDKLGCRRVARAYLRGDGVDQNVAKGEAFLWKACQGGDVRACSDYVSQIRDDQPDKALAISRKTCDADDQASVCLDAAELLMAQGRADDARPYADKACRVSEAWCRPLIRMYQTGKGATKDPAAAQALIKKICADDFAKSLDGLDPQGPLCSARAAGKRLTAKPKR
jgi:TPR repeat protein